jgi:2-haloacid dehalogenase
MDRRKWLTMTILSVADRLSARTGIQALTFDVFGTVVDWRSTIIREGKALGKAKGIETDWARFADAWRAGYGPAMNRVRKGEIGWTKIDELHRMILDQILRDLKIDVLSEEEKAHFNRVWHRLQPWPDSIEGLTRLRRQYTLATLSNGNVSLLSNMARYAGLPWDVILSAELARHYKPDREVYQMAADYLSLKPEQVLMVAAHKNDLHASRRIGMKTAFVPRPLEHGPGGKAETTPDPEFDFVARDFVELAEKLGC